MSTKLCPSFDRGSLWKSLFELLVPLQSQSQPVPVSQLVRIVDFQLPTSRSLVSRHAVAPATCSSFDHVSSTIDIFVPYRWSSDLHCFDSFHREGSRVCKKVLCEMLRHLLRQISICKQFLNIQQSHQSILVHEPKRTADVVVWTHRVDLFCAKTAAAALSVTC